MLPGIEEKLTKTVKD